MTALCGGGTSGPKLGSAIAVDYTSGLVAEYLSGLALEWLTPVIPLAVIPPLVLSAFCGSDPPAMPTLTSDEANALLQLDLTNPNFTSGLPKAVAIFENVIWLQNCQCTSGSLTPPALPSPPSGTFTPGYQSLTPGNTCATVDLGSGIDLTTSSPCQDIWTLQLLDSGGHVINSIGTPAISAESQQTLQLAIPSNAASWIVNVDSFGGCGSFARGGATLAGLAGPSIVQGTFTEHYVSATNTTQRRSVVNVICGPNGSQYQGSQCCPTDPATQAQLDAILALVTLIQRQVAPFAFLAGTTHSALSGNGHFNVQGLLGARIVVTTPPNVRSTIGGDVNTRYGNGWFNWCNLSGCTAREFISEDVHLSFPPLAGQYTIFRYSLPTGMVINMQEIVREP